MIYKIHFKAKNKLVMFLMLFIFSGIAVFLFINNAPLPQILIAFIFVLLFAIVVYGAFSWRLKLENDIVTLSAFGVKPFDIPARNILFIRPREKLDFIRAGHGPKNERTVIGYFYEEGFQKYVDLICFGFSNTDYYDFIKSILEKNSDIQVKQPENSMM